jgi:hypothetical protein
MEFYLPGGPKKSKYYSAHTHILQFKKTHRKHTYNHIQLKIKISAPVIKRKLSPAASSNHSIIAAFCAQDV